MQSTRNLASNPYKRSQSKHTQWTCLLWLGALTIACLSTAAPARADTIELVSGLVYEGTVVTQTAATVTVRLASGTVRLRRSQIASIKRTPDQPDDPPEPPGPVVPIPVSPTPATLTPVTPAQPTAPTTAADRVNRLITLYSASPKRASARAFIAIGNEAAQPCAHALERQSVPSPIRVALAQAIADLPPDPQTLPALLRVVNQADLDLSPKAAKLIARLGPEARLATGELRRIALDPHARPVIQKAILEALVALAPPAGANTASLLLTHADHGVRLTARRILAASKDLVRSPAVLDNLVEALKHGDWQVRFEAANLLETPLKNATVSELKRLASSDPEGAVRASAMRALGRSPLGQHCAETMLAGLADTDATTRIAACDAVRTHRIVNAVLPLIRLLRDADTQVRQRASQALEHITGQRLGTSSASWRRWWQHGGSAQYPGRS